jgi:hypothetical protein
MINIVSSTGRVILFQPERSGFGLHELVGAFAFFSAVFAILTILSCRSCLSFLKFLHFDPMKYTPYKIFYKYHSYYWILFGAALLIHLVSGNLSLAARFGSILFSSRQLIIPGLGLGILITTIAILFSCRIYPQLLVSSGAKNHSPLTNPLYKSFFKLHTYLWWIFGIFVIGHVVAIALLREGFR